MEKNLLTRSLDVLETVISREGVRFGELLEIHRINRTTLTKILKHLVARGYLAKDGSGYGRGAMLARLANVSATEQWLIERFAPCLKELTNQWGVTSLLIVHQGGQTRFIDKQVRDHTLFGRPVGEAFPLSAALPWDLHWMRATGGIGLDEARADADAFWAERARPAYQPEDFRAYYETAAEPGGCLGLSPGFPCEARGAVPIRLAGSALPDSYLGFIAITDSSTERRAWLRQVFAAFSETARVARQAARQGQ